MANYLKMPKKSQVTRPTRARLELPSHESRDRRAPGNGEPVRCRAPGKCGQYVPRLGPVTTRGCPGHSRLGLSHHPRTAPSVSRFPFPTYPLDRAAARWEPLPLSIRPALSWGSHRRRKAATAGAANEGRGSCPCRAVALVEALRFVITISSIPKRKATQYLTELEGDRSGRAETRWSSVRRSGRRPSCGA